MSARIGVSLPLPVLNCGQYCGPLERAGFVVESSEALKATALKEVAVGAGILVNILAAIAFVSSLVICYAVVLIKNSKRDVYHQTPILKAFLYALGWTPVVFICILLMLKMMG